MVALHLLPRNAADGWLAYNTVRRIHREQGRWVECNPYYFNSIPGLRRHFPQARFVFVTRNPRGFCESHIRWERQRINSRIANQLVPFWGPVSYHQQLLGLFGSYRQRVHYYAKVWTRRNAVILDHLSCDASAIRLRFEDVFDSPDGPARLTALLRELDIAQSHRVDEAVLRTPVNHTDRGDGAQWDEWCDGLVAQHCGSLMGRLGYSVDR